VRGAILVCEDDDDVAALVVDMLTQLGHAPTRVSTAAAALGALADGRQVDLLFSDVMMPGGMDGLALAREATRRRPGLPVLLTTGYTGGPGAEPIGVPVLRKPYSIDDLAQALARALKPAETLQTKPGFVASEHV
jgi:CheY-like chemotaxis protein